MSAIVSVINSIGSLNAIAQASAGQIVDCLLEGTVIAVLAGVMLRLTRRQQSGTRFAVWFSALIAIATLPLFSTALSSAWTSSSASRSFDHAAVILPGTWALYLFGVWAAIAAFQLVGVARGLWHIRSLRKSGEAVDVTALDARLQETLARASARKVQLCVSDQVQVPTAIGLMKPAVMLPRWILQELSTDELNQILLHELAHLRRWDDWTNLAQKIVKAVLFFHPAVWWVEKRVSLEREMACDEAVVAETASPRAYAECLARLAEMTFVQRSVALAQAALGRIHQTSMRVARILDVNRPAGTGKTRKSMVALASVTAIVCVAGLSRAPRLVAFSDAGSGHMASASFDAVTDHSSPSLPVVRTSAKIVPQRSAPLLTPANLTTQRKPATPRRSTAIKSPSVNQIANTQVLKSNNPAANVQIANTLIHLASFETTPFGFTETVFVVVQGEPNNSSVQPHMQIQMWHVVVLRSAVDDSNRIPPKRT